MSEISETEIKAMTKEQNYMRGYKDGKSDVLDKIRAEIVDLGQRTMNDNRASGIWACRDIIDKHNAESEEV
jgi:hypothetical protein